MLTLAGYQGNKVTFTSGSIFASATANLFTYNVGPVIKARSGRFEPFGEVLFGGAHSSFYGDLCKTFTRCVVNNPSNNAFDFVLGGGIESRSRTPSPSGPFKRITYLPVCQRIYLRKPEPEQLPLSGRHSDPLLSNSIHCLQTALLVQKNSVLRTGEGVNLREKWI